MYNSRSACLLYLLGFLESFALASLLRSFRASLSIHNIVPPPETAGVVADEALMVNIVVIGARPKGKEVVQTPWELVPAMRIDGLEETEYNPAVHGEDVKVSSGEDPRDGDADGSEAEEEHLDWRSVFSGEAKGRRVGVVDLVDGLVQRAPVKGAVHPVMPGVLNDEEDGDLKGHGGEGGKGDARVHTAELGHGVEQPDLGQLDGAMAQEDQLGASPLFRGRGDLLPLDLVSLEIRDQVHDDEGNAATEVDDLVHDEAHDSSG